MPREVVEFIKTVWAIIATFIEENENVPEKIKELFSKIPMPY